MASPSCLTPAGERRGAPIAVAPLRFLWLVVLSCLVFQPVSPFQLVSRTDAAAGARRCLYYKPLPFSPLATRLPPNALHRSSTVSSATNLFNKDGSCSTCFTRLGLRRRGGGDNSNVNDEYEDDDFDSDKTTEQQAAGGGGAIFQQEASPLLQETSKILRRVSFFSWWSQVILTSVSGVILVFARNVLGGARARDAALQASDPSFFLSGLGVVISAVSILWTWGNGARLSRRLTRRDRPVSRIQAANMLRRAVRVGVTVNLAGLLVHLLAAEEIVGSLAIRVLTSSRQLQGSAAMFSTMEGLQPLDVLIVQANTNSLLSHFCSLASLLLLTGRVAKLDPPSTEDG